MRTPRSRRTIVAVLAAVGVSAALAACGGSGEGAAPASTTPEVTTAADAAEVAMGQRVFVASCSSCHGKGGEGGRGPRLNDGRVADHFPQLADQIALITGGKAGMPAFEAKLTDEEIAAVARYVREQL